MNRHNIQSHSKALCSAMLITVICGTNALAAPGTLATQPLIVETQPVPPNIYFVIDDSGSMAWEDLIDENVFSYDNGSAQRQNEFGSKLDRKPVTSGNSKPNLRNRLLCAGYNVLAYNPSVTYTPPHSTVYNVSSSSFNRFADSASIDANKKIFALSTPGSSNTTEITDHSYVIWTDANNNGTYDGPGDNNPYSDNDECNIAQPVNLSDFLVDYTAGSAIPAEILNYANWFTYYRTRDLVMKKALSDVIANADERMGLNTIHNRQTFAVQSMGDAQTGVQNRTQLLETLFKVTPGDGTPLRTALQRAGDYFAGNNSPILAEADGGSCQKNFAIVISDGYWNGSDPSGIDDVDGDGHSKTLADVALHYYNADFKNYPNLVPTSGRDLKTTQHLNTYTIAFGLNGEISTAATDDTVWPKPVANQKTTIDDMRHAAWNGRGEFLSAKNPAALAESINEALLNINATTSTAAAAAVNSISLQNDNMIYMASYSSSDWSGALTAYKITIADSNAISYTKEWNAADKIPEVANRTIHVLDDNGDLVQLKTAPSNVAADLISGKPASYTTGDYVSRAIDFLYGSHADEVGVANGKALFRNRNGKELADIVNSSPVFVGAPSMAYADNLESVPYSSFVAQYGSGENKREGTVYLGSNGGMLHAINAVTGVERYAYIPRSVLSTEKDSGLHALASTNYNVRHRDYVDLTPAIADVFMGNDGWRTYLVGGLRGGGKSIFVMDITDETKPTVKFELSDAQLGYTYSDIQIVRMNNGKWAAVFGNGYNNDPSGDGSAQLFIVYLDGSNKNTPIKLSTKTGSMANQSCNDPDSDCNGLSTPNIADINGDGSMDRAFAGDLHGNLWVFDLSSNNDAEWQTAYGDSSNPLPLFTACSKNADKTCGVTNRQPITSMPAIARHPKQQTMGTDPNIMVMFGTGQYLTVDDLNDTASQSFYAVWDRGDVNSLNRFMQFTPDTNDPNTKSGRFVEQTIAQTLTSEGKVMRKIDPSEIKVSYSSNKDFSQYGWFVDLPTSKERITVSPVAYGSAVFFNSMIPNESGRCGVSGGTGWIMALDILNGGQPGFHPLDVNNDNRFDALDSENNAAQNYAVGIQLDGLPTASRFVSGRAITIDSTISDNGNNLNISNVQGAPNSGPVRSSWTN